MRSLVILSVKSLKVSTLFRLSSWWVLVNSLFGCKRSGYLKRMSCFALVLMHWGYKITFYGFSFAGWPTVTPVASSPEKVCNLKQWKLYQRKTLVSPKKISIFSKPLTFLYIATQGYFPMPQKILKLCQVLHLLQIAFLTFSGFLPEWATSAQMNVENNAKKTTFNSLL